MAYLPADIRWHILHPGVDAQIQGFQDLFILLDSDPAPDSLRATVVAYFNRTPRLREHLREPALISSAIAHHSCDSDSRIQVIQTPHFPSSKKTCPTQVGFGFAAGVFVIHMTSNRISELFCKYSRDAFFPSCTRRHLGIRSLGLGEDYIL